MLIQNDNNRNWKRATGGIMMGRTTLKNDMMSNDASTAQVLGAELEIMYNKTQEDPLDMAGRPVVRGKEAGGGPACAYKNTQVLGGADFAESVHGNSYNFAGVFPFNLDNLHRTDGEDEITLFVASFTQAPSVGDTLTSSGGGTGVVVRVDGLNSANTLLKFTAYNYVTIRRTNTTAWAAAETITSDDLAGVAMAPTPATLTIVSVGDTQVANANATDGYSDSDLTADFAYEMVWILTHGITMAWWDDRNGAIADGSPGTWSDAENTFVLAGLNTSGPDNIVVTALQAETATAVHQLLKSYVFGVEPINFFKAGTTSGMTTPGEQGVEGQG